MITRLFWTVWGRLRGTQYVARIGEVRLLPSIDAGARDLPTISTPWILPTIDTAIRDLEDLTP